LKWYWYRTGAPSVGESVKLHVGCGSVKLPGFINIDLNPWRHVHYLRDVSSQTMWKTGEADLIYASHVLEHFDRVQVRSVLRNWFTFLKSTGILRLSVPNFESLMYVYEYTGKNIESVEPAIMGGQSNQHDYHKSIFTKDKLTSMLEEIGFIDIVEWEPREVLPKDIKDWSMWQEELNGILVKYSLNIEARKL